ncbi:AMP-binding protein, partial [Bacillus sp. SIMBA_031]|uniref:AMP-binding protein n=1 Tax=Bacillus sp. SIMBA_031 TaxID=3085774 RepID=UPI00397BEE58
EALSPGKLSSYNLKYPSTKLINMYGITETTVHVTYKDITASDIVSNISNIGTAIPTLRCYVLDDNQQLLPVGVSGELYVGGDGVSRGYLNRDE